MIEIIQSGLLSGFAEIKHFFSTRRGGYSTPPFHWANMSLKAGDPWAMRNRIQLSEILHVPLERFIFLKQTHGNNIHIATERDAGKGSFSYNNAVENTDALITDQPCLMLTITTADCVPILVFDKKNKVIAAIHAGWRGTAKRITALTIEKIINEYSSKPQNIFAAIGPSIGQCCYEVDHDVLTAFTEEQGQEAEKFFSPKGQKLMLDLWQANKQQLLSLGIPEKNIDLTEICTSCHNQSFYSARRGDKGRQIAGIMLNKHL